MSPNPATDWSKVNIEALRQHLIDMDEVTMHTVVSQRNVPGGIEMDVTGEGRTTSGTKRMAMAHTKMLDQPAEYHASTIDIARGDAAAHER